MLSSVWSSGLKLSPLSCASSSLCVGLCVALLTDVTFVSGGVAFTLFSIMSSCRRSRIWLGTLVFPVDRHGCSFTDVVIAIAHVDVWGLGVVVARRIPHLFGAIFCPNDLDQPREMCCRAFRDSWVGV